MNFCLLCLFSIQFSKKHIYSQTVQFYTLLTASRYGFPAASNSGTAQPRQTPTYVQTDSDSRRCREIVPSYDS